MGTMIGTASFREWSRSLGSHFGWGCEASKGLGELPKHSPASAKKSDFCCGNGSWSGGPVQAGLRGRRAGGSRVWHQTLLCRI